MPGSVPIYYWDTCLFLAWLNDEQRKTGEMDGVREMIGRAKRREVALMTSVITTIEILSAKLPVGTDHLLKDMMRRINKVGVDSKVAGLAHDLRDYYTTHSARYQNKTLSTPDAIHLASAIMFRANEFHTFDSKGSSKVFGSDSAFWQRCRTWIDDMCATGKKSPAQPSEAVAIDQRERFEQAARELGVELDEEKLKEVLRDVALDRAHRKRHVNSGGGKSQDAEVLDDKCDNEHPD